MSFVRLRKKSMNSRDHIYLLTILFSFCILTVITSCGKRSNSSEIPECINTRIADFKKTNSCSSAMVKEYEFQHEVVFVFDPGKCGADMTSEVLNSSCNTLGYLGGISGNMKINGEDFSKAKETKVLWKH